MRQKLQVALILGVVIAALETGYIFYQRHEDNVADKKFTQVSILSANPDNYIVPRTLHAYDLRSAKQLTQQPVWAKEGYTYAYFPYDRTSHRVDFSKEAGLLGSVEKLHVTSVIVAGNAKSPQVMAVFEKEGRSYALSIGSEQGGDYHIYADEMFFIQDPHDLYKHWSKDIWDSIDHHEAKLGMNELQVDFAIGLGVPESQGNPKTVNYNDGGHSISVVFKDGKAAEIKP